jgi:hypothetical protein
VRLGRTHNRPGGAHRLEPSFEIWHRDLAELLETGDITSDVATVATLCDTLDGNSLDYLTGSGPDFSEATRALALDAETRLFGA